MRLPRQASIAPNTPQIPQAAICQGVQGPCPSQKFETRPASAPTAKPGAAPIAYPEKITMSVVATTFGIAAKARRPATASAASAATRATTCDGGRDRSYQANPASRTAPRTTKLQASQLIPDLPQAPALPARA